MFAALRHVMAVRRRGWPDHPIFCNRHLRRMVVMWMAKHANRVWDRFGPYLCSEFGVQREDKHGKPKKFGPYTAPLSYAQYLHALLCK